MNPYIILLNDTDSYDEPEAFGPFTHRADAEYHAQQLTERDPRLITAVIELRRPS